MKLYHWRQSAYLIGSFCVPVVLLALYGLRLHGPASVRARADAERVTQSWPVGFSLERMIDEAEYIFVANVADVRPGFHKKLIENEKVPVPVRLIRFELEKFELGKLKLGKFHSDKRYVFKGPSLTDKHFKITQDDQAAVAVEEQKTLLLYLDKPTKSEYRYPVGDLSGYFKVETDQKDTRYRVAINLVGNRGLWSNEPNTKLWSQSIRRPLAEEFVRANDIPESRLLLGDERCQPRAVPLELLLAATYAKLNTPIGAHARP